MNWMGGFRNRLSKEDRRRQQEYFARLRMEKNLAERSSSEGPNHKPIGGIPSIPSVADIYFASKLGNSALYRDSNGASLYASTSVFPYGSQPMMTRKDVVPLNYDPKSVGKKIPHRMIPRPSAASTSDDSLPEHLRNYCQLVENNLAANRPRVKEKPNDSYESEHLKASISKSNSNTENIVKHQPKEKKIKFRDETEIEPPFITFEHDEIPRDVQFSSPCPTILDFETFFNCGDDIPSTSTVQTQKFQFDFGRGDGQFETREKVDGPTYKFLTPSSTESSKSKYDKYCAPKLVQSTPQVLNPKIFQSPQGTLNEVFSFSAPVQKKPPEIEDEYEEDYEKWLMAKIMDELLFECPKRVDQSFFEVTSVETNSRDTSKSPTEGGWTFQVPQDNPKRHKDQLENPGSRQDIQANPGSRHDQQNNLKLRQENPGSCHDQRNNPKLHQVNPGSHHDKQNNPGSRHDQQNNPSPPRQDQQDNPKPRRQDQQDNPRSRHDQQNNPKLHQDKQGNLGSCHDQQNNPSPRRQDQQDNPESRQDQRDTAMSFRNKELTKKRKNNGGSSEVSKGMTQSSSYQSTIISLGSLNSSYEEFTSTTDDQSSLNVSNQSQQEEQEALVAKKPVKTEDVAVQTEKDRSYESPKPNYIETGVQYDELEMRSYFNPGKRLWYSV